MNILMVSDGYFPERVGGSYRYLSGLSRELVRRGHQVHVLVPKIEKPLSDIETIDGVAIHRFEYIRVLPLVSFLSQVINSRRMFKKILREVKPSMISFHHALPSFGIVTIRAIKKMPKVFTFYGPWGEEYRTRVKTSLLSGIYTKLMSFVERFVINRCRSILVLSEFSKGQLKEIHGVSPEKVSVIPGGLDIGFFSPSDKTAARERLKIPEDSKILFTVRRLDPRMGLDVLLRAFKIVAAKVKGVRLLIGGTGPSISVLIKLRDELGLTDLVDFLGHVSEADLPYYYRAADISVLPSRVLEGFGLMTIESLSCGTPVVGTPVGSTTEILGKFEEKLLFKDSNADSMAEKIIDIFYGDDKDILYMSKKCRSFVEENYNWSKIAQLVEEFYLLTGRKRILVIDSASEIGGAEIFLLRFLEKLDKNKYIPQFLLLQKGGSLSDELSKRGYQIINVSMDFSTWRKGQSKFNALELVILGIRSIPQLFQVLFRLKRMGIDIIQTSCNKSHIFGTILGFLAGIPVLWTLHDFISKEHFSFPLRKLLVSFSFFADRIIAFSDAARRQFVCEGAVSEKIVTIHHGIDADSFRGEAAGNIRNELGISEKKKIVTVIGRISYWKGQEYLIKGIPKIIKQYPDSIFLFVGDTLFGERAVKQKLEELIRDEELTDYCIMTGWRRDIPDILKETDILVHTSSQPEPFGLVLLEGMVMGKPIVATNAGGVPEIIADRVTGILVKPADANAIADAVIYILSNPEIGRKMGRAGQERVERLFDVKMMVKKIENVYAEISHKGFAHR